jgi:mono/diheme cytochrome c family protein
MRTINFFLLLSLVFVSTTAVAGPIEEGRVLFSSRCASCHNVNQQLTGPALAGVEQRRSMEWIVGFVRSSRSMISGGDSAAVALYGKYRTPMPDHPDLTEENIRQIVEYIKSEAKPLDQMKGPFAKPAYRPNLSRPLSYKDIGFFGAYLLAVAGLVAVLLWGVHVKSLQVQKEQVSKP